MAEGNNQNLGNEKRNEQRRRRYRERKEEDPEFTKRESEKRKAKRTKNPDFEKLKRQNQHRQILNDAFDKLFHENKHTFSNPISITKWENLKRDYLDFLFSDVFSPGDNTIKELMEDRRKYIVILQENPNFHCAASIIFQIKTLIPYAKDNARKLTKEEVDWINSLDATSPEKIKKSYGQKEYKREK